VNVYLDHNATTPVHPEVREAVGPYLESEFGNPSTLYSAGRRAADAVSAARARVAGMLGCQPGFVVFTGGGTEANNLAIKGTFIGRSDQERRHIVISAIEHSSVYEPAVWLREVGAEVTIVPVDVAGRVNPVAVADAIREDTLLVSVMHANNETGVIQPVAEIAERTRERGVLCHVDGVQAAGKLPVRLDDIGCDLYAVSAHKIGGMKGAGALYVRNPHVLTPMLHGGGHEAGLRAGTENVPGIVAMGKAAEVATRELAGNVRRWLATRAVFEELADRLRFARVNGLGAERLPNTVSLCCLYADAMSVVLGLSTSGVFVGTGAACSSNSREPSRVLREMGLSDSAAESTIRLSAGPDLSVEQARDAADRIVAVIDRIRATSLPSDVGKCGSGCSCFRG